MGTTPNPANPSQWRQAWLVTERGLTAPDPGFDIVTP